MRRVLSVTTGLVLFGTAFGIVHAQGAAKRPFPCFKHHGRLMGGLNGITTRLWLIGTNRVLAVDNGVYLPGDADKYFDAASPDFSVIYGDFEICPLAPDVPGEARSVEVVGFEKLVVQNVKDASKPPFRLLSTWPKTDRSTKQNSK